MESASTVIIEKIFIRPIENVWNAWTNPLQIMKWFGSDPNGTVVQAALDVRPGGSFSITFQDADLSEHTCYGMYTEVQEYSKLTFTWNWKNEPGIESFINLNLFPDGNQTFMLFEHSNTGTASAHQYDTGWKSCFLKLEKVL